MLLEHWLGGNKPIVFVKVIAIIMVLILPPVLLTAKKITHSRRWLTISGFLILPLIYGIIYQRMFLNVLLKKGIGDNTFLLGTPNIILLHFVLMLLLLFLFHKRLTDCFRI